MRASKPRVACVMGMPSSRSAICRRISDSVCLCARTWGGQICMSNLPKRKRERKNRNHEGRTHGTSDVAHAVQVLDFAPRPFLLDLPVRSDPRHRDVDVAPQLALREACDDINVMHEEQDSEFPVFCGTRKKGGRERGEGTHTPFPCWRRKRRRVARWLATS